MGDSRQRQLAVGLNQLIALLWQRFGNAATGLMEQIYRKLLEWLIEIGRVEN